MTDLKQDLKSLFTPFAKISKTTRVILFSLQAIILLLFLQFNEYNTFPKPLDIFHSLVHILQSRNFYEDLCASFILTFKSMFVAIMIATIFSYLFLLPFFEGISKFITYFRFLTLTGLSFVFLLIFKDAGTFKVSLMVFGIVPFFVTSLIAAFTAIDKQELELTRTLKMGSWQSLYELVMVGRLDQVLFAVGFNFAIGWGMISFVESQAMGEGGIGTIMAKNMKYFNLSLVFAILTIILTIGTAIDFIIAYIRKVIFPYISIQTIN
jgi:ABC-type nitrate/sulfonate/bicarbonate transport system permease component